MVKTKIVVNVSDAKISNDPDDTIVTHSLGSCIAVCLYDNRIRSGGMLHFQLPHSKGQQERAMEKPFMFADTGMEILINNLLSLGANRRRMQVKIAGGAAIDNAPNGFDIGKRNHLSIRKILWKNGMFIDAEDIGGCSPRNMYMNIASGAVTVRSNGLEKNL